MQPRPQPLPSRYPTAPRRRRARDAAGVAAALWLGWQCGPCTAELYRWVDETGTTVYSQVPPPATTATTTIKPDKAPPPAAGKPAADRLRRAAEQSFDRREEQARQAAEAEKKAAAQAARRTNCNAARTNLETLKNHGRGRIRTPDGEVRFRSGEELERMQQEAEGQIRDNCD